MTMFFIGCMHLGHKNILKLANRPFASIEEHNEALVERFNSVVTNRDAVYIMGDFCWDDPAYWLGRLNGTKHLILGNHDDEREFDFLPRHLLDGYSHYRFTKQEGARLALFHYPIDDWEGRWSGSIHLHAHTHAPEFRNPSLPRVVNGFKDYPNDDEDGLPAKYPRELKCNRFNVGADAINFTPISLDAILAASKI